MTRTGVSAVVLLVPALACAPVAPAPAPAAAPPQVAPGPPVAPAVATAPPAPPPKLQIRSHAIEPLSSAPHVEIQFPFAEQRIPSDKAASYVVRLKIEELARAGAGARVVLALDQFRPRSLDDIGTPPRLSALVPVTHALAPGPHSLHAVVVDARGRIVRAEKPSSRAPFATVRFWVGDRGERAPPAPLVVLVEPAGTYNGASVEVWVDFLPLFAPEGASARVRVRGADGREGEAPLDGPAELVDLSSGDYDVAVSLMDAGGVALTSAERTITVNRELGSGE